MKRFLTVFVALAFLFAANPVHAATIQGNFMTSLSEHWRFEETSGDRMGSAQSYVLTDRNTVTTMTGKRGTAALFTAANLESLDMTDNASTSVTASWSASYWVYFTSIAVAPSYQTAVAKFGSTGTQRSYRMLHSGDTQLLQVSSTGANVANGVWSETLTSGSWYHICLIYNAASASSTLVINGAPKGSKTALFTSIFDNNQAFELGKSSSPNEYYLDAGLDEFTLWKGRELTTTECNTLYNAGAGIHWNTEDAATTTPIISISGNTTMSGNILISK